MSLLIASQNEGVLECLLPGSKSKWESYGVKVADGLITFSWLKSNPLKTDKIVANAKKGSKFSILKGKVGAGAAPKPKPLKEFTGNGVVEVYPLTYIVMEELQKKEKAKTNWSFVLNSLEKGKKWRTVCSCASAEQLATWKAAIERSTFLASTKIFGTTVTDSCLKANRYVPPIFTETVKLIEQNTKVEGIFRISAEANAMNVLKEQFDKGLIPALPKHDPHLASGILKQYLRELHEPLVPFKARKGFLTSAGIEDTTKRIQAFQNQMHALPLANKVVFGYLIKCLNLVQKDCAENLMDIKNLSIVFGPTCLREEENVNAAKWEGIGDAALASKVIEDMILHYDKLFSDVTILHDRPVFASNHTGTSESRAHMNQVEQVIIASDLQENQIQMADQEEPKDVFDPKQSLSYLVNIINPRTKDLEQRIFVADKTRGYFFHRGGRIDTQFHFLSIKHLQSLHKNELTITFEENQHDLELDDDETGEDLSGEDKKKPVKKRNRDKVGTIDTGGIPAAPAAEVEKQTSTRGPAPGTQPVADTDSDSKSKLQSTDSKQDLGANQRKGSTNKLLIKKRSHAKVISEGSGDVMKSESVEDNKSRDANSGDSKSSSSAEDSEQATTGESVPPINDEQKPAPADEPVVQGSQSDEDSAGGPGEDNKPTDDIYKVVVDGEKSNLRKITIVPISHCSFDVDNIIVWLAQQTEEILPGAPETEKFGYHVLPEDRWKQICEKIVIPDTPCGGFTHTYTCVSNYFRTPPSAAVIWEMTNYISPKKVRTFNFGTMLKNKDKLPNPEFHALLYSLRFNQWFTSFVCSGVTLGNEALEVVASLLGANSTLREIVIKGATGNSPQTKGMDAMLKAFLKNKRCAVRILDLSNNNLESSSTQSLISQCLGQYGPLCNITVLNLSSTCLHKKMLSALFTTLSHTALHYLGTLNLSGCKFDDNSSFDLGEFLAFSQKIQYLNLDGCNPDFNMIANGMVNKNHAASCGTLTNLSLAFSQMKKFENWENFIARIPNISVLNLTSTGVTQNALQQMGAWPLTEINISENEWAHVDILTFFKAFLVPQFNKPDIVVLKMDRVFSRNKKNEEFIKLVGNRLLNSSSLTELSIQGYVSTGGFSKLGVPSSALKEDLIYLIDALASNRSIKKLDISHHHVGPELGVSLAKMLQTNWTLTHLRFDGNDTNASSLKLILSGLQRNTTLQVMPVPLVDLMSILKQSSNEAEEVTKIVEEMQTIVHQNALGIIPAPALDLEGDSLPVIAPKVFRPVSAPAADKKALIASRRAGGTGFQSSAGANPSASSASTGGLASPGGVSFGLPPSMPTPASQPIGESSPSVGASEDDPAPALIKPALSRKSNARRQAGVYKMNPDLLEMDADKFDEEFGDPTGTPKEGPPDVVRSLDSSSSPSPLNAALSWKKVEEKADEIAPPIQMGKVPPTDSVESPISPKRIIVRGKGTKKDKKDKNDEDDLKSPKDTKDEPGPIGKKKDKDEIKREKEEAKKEEIRQAELKKEEARRAEEAKKEQAKRDKEQAKRDQEQAKRDKELAKKAEKKGDKDKNDNKDDKNKPERSNSILAPLDKEIDIDSARKPPPERTNSTVQNTPPQVDVVNLPVTDVNPSSPLSPKNLDLKAMMHSSQERAISPRSPHGPGDSPKKSHPSIAEVFWNAPAQEREADEREVQANIHALMAELASSQGQNLKPEILGDEAPPSSTRDHHHHQHHQSGGGSDKDKKDKRDKKDKGSDKAESQPPVLSRTSRRPGAMRREVPLFLKIQIKELKQLKKLPVGNQD